MPLEQPLAVRVRRPQLVDSVGAHAHITGIINTALAVKSNVFNAAVYLVGGSERERSLLANRAGSSQPRHVLPSEASHSAYETMVPELRHADGGRSARTLSTLRDYLAENIRPAKVWPE